MSNETFDYASYYSMIDNMKQMKSDLIKSQKTNKKYEKDRIETRKKMKLLETYIQKEMMKCKCDYTKSNAKIELERIQQYFKKH